MGAQNRWPGTQRTRLARWGSVVRDEFAECWGQQDMINRSLRRVRGCKTSSLSAGIGRTRYIPKGKTVGPYAGFVPRWFCSCAF